MVQSLWLEHRENWNTQHSLKNLAHLCRMFPADVAVLPKTRDKGRPFFCSAKRIRGAEDRAILVGDHKQLGPVITEHNLCRAYLSMLERCLWFTLGRSDVWVFFRRTVVKIGVWTTSQQDSGCQIFSKNTLPETNSSPVKIDVWKTLVPFLGCHVFRCELLVSGRVSPRRRNGVWKPRKFSPQFFLRFLALENLQAQGKKWGAKKKGLWWISLEMGGCGFVKYLSRPFMVKWCLRMKLHLKFKWLRGTYKKSCWVLLMILVVLGGSCYCCAISPFHQVRATKTSDILLLPGQF